MKALKILKSAEQLGFSGKQIIISEYKLNKAIEELEELQNRSCKNCKFGMIDMFDNDIECVKIEAETQGTYFTSDFCCNKWESK